jgi:hypothetical protein
LSRHAAKAACLMISLVAATARLSAQQGMEQPGPVPLAGPSHVSPPEFLSRYDFQLAANALSIDDPRFSWDTHFGGAVDLVDYGVGRLSIVGDYEAVLGQEFRAFDPNQAYYILEASASAFAGDTEIVGVFHHVSRHLSDRPKRYAIAWNALGARVMRQVRIEQTTLSMRADFGRAIQHADVDYRWLGGLDVTVRQRLSSRYGLFGRASGEMATVDETLRHRDTQHGARLEGGVRIEGRAAALELLAGFERRLDADPVDYQPQEWLFAGFRIVSK